MTIEKRIFIVGCSRSGTTLLQSLLAAHPDIISFPEAKFFLYIIALYEPKRLALGIPSGRFYPWIVNFLKEVGYPELAKNFSQFPLPIKWQFKKFIKCLDHITIEQGKSIWLEKTPENIRYIDKIEAWLPNAKFIHIIRNGTDVVASLYDVGQKYPIWQLDTIENCIQRWINDVSLSLKYLSKPNHVLVRYENLVTSPQLCLQKLCNFIDVEFRQEMLNDYRQAAKQVIRSKDHWKKAVTEDIKNRNQTKFNGLFNEEEKAYIQKRVATINLDDIESF